MLFLLGRNGVIMNNIQKYFLEALKASLENKKVEWVQEMTSEEWRMLFQMAEIHHVLPMIYDAVYACASIQYCDENVLASCKYKMKQQVLGQIMKTSEFLRLYHMLNKQHLYPVMVKGIVCRELYPNPDYRISGDEDMLIEEKDFSLYHELFTQYGMVVVDEKADLDKDYEIPYGKKGSPIYIELHKHLFPPTSKAYGEFNRYFEDVHEKAIEINVQKVKVKTMNPTMHLFYLITHAFKHFVHSGFGIRQVCDILLFAKAYYKDICWETIVEQCKYINALKFTVALFQIGKKYLSIEVDLPKAMKEVQVEEEALLLDLLNSGVYGDADMSRKHSSTITLNALSNTKEGKSTKFALLGTLFPAKEALVGKYPYLKKYPFLLPLAWGNRFLHYFKEIKNTNNNDAMKSVEIGNERIELMRKYDIL